MLCDYYFKKWKGTLINLTRVVELDLEYQETKIHDKQICDAVQRLAGMLGSYISCYNDALDCLQHNLQVQKTKSIADVLEKIVTRILELKHQLTKLEGTHFQFLSNGLIERKLTPFETEFLNVPAKYDRPEIIKLAIEAAFHEVEKLKKVEAESLENSKCEKNLRDGLSENVNWWDNSVTINVNEHKGINVTEVYKVEEKISEETLKRREIIALIQAHERNRQVVRVITHKKQKREIWEKELKGILKPQAPLALRERSAKLIQRVLRYYFELKRTKVNDCRRDELLQLSNCVKLKTDESQMDKAADPKYYKLYKKYKKQREIDCFQYKEDYLKKNRDDIAEEFRDHIREWFQKWYSEAQFFYDIPKENQGGPALIFKEELPSPLEWLDDYKAYLETKKANKNKTALQLKWEKEEGKEEEMLLKREELKKKKLEAVLLKKMMKNPTLHPGYHYPISKKTNSILKAIQNYYDHWSEIDNGEANEAKEKCVQKIDEECLCMEAKLEICNSIINDMMDELKLLKKSLKQEYERNGEQMPNPKKEKIKRKMKENKRKIKDKIRDDLQDMLTDLAIRGYLKEYPKMNFGNFIGDVSYAGADLRCKLISTVPFAGEIRAVWWERCREVTHGFRRILLVGPRESGKTTLVHIMATVNDATLYELDPFKNENTKLNYLQELIDSVVTCAKATQPSVIYIRHIERLYYTKVPPEEAYKNFDLIKKFFIQKLFKKINNQDNITIIGSCLEPWLTKSKQMLKKFNSVLLLPETTYSTVHLILRNWSLNNRIVPHNFDIQSLAHVLQGYPFGHILKKLDNFLTAERIVHIAAYGLNPREIFNFFLEDGNDYLVNYEKYLKWYRNKTYWGQLEQKCLEERREFQIIVQKWKEKMLKKEKDT